MSGAPRLGLGMGSTKVRVAGCAAAVVALGMAWATPGIAAESEPKIQRIHAPDCLADDSEIRVEGQKLRKKGLKCSVESKGKRHRLKPVSKDDRQFRYSAGDALAKLPGPDFRIQCELGKEREETKLRACPQKKAAKGAPTLERSNVVPSLGSKIKTPVAELGKSAPAVAPLPKAVDLSNARPAVYTLSLKVNGQTGATGPVEVPRGGAMQVSWELPDALDSERYQRLQLRASGRSSFQPCEPGEGARLGDLAGVSAARSYGPSSLPRGAAVPVNLGSPAFAEDRYVYFMACVEVDRAARTVVRHVEPTNVVEVRYGSPPTPREADAARNVSREEPSLGVELRRADREAITAPAATCFGKPVTILGTPGDDVLDGTGTLAGTADVIHGMGGNDTINGFDGNDYLCGGEGNDRIWGELGNDWISGGPGDDGISAGMGADRVEGGYGNDRIMGEGGGDTLEGGDGNDEIFGGTGNDTLDGGAGNDQLDGGPGIDRINGRAGNNTCEVDSADTLTVNCQNL